MEDKIINFFVGVITGYLVSKVYEHEYKSLYQNKLNSLENRINKLEEFRITIYEKNLILNEKREWDDDSSDDQLSDDEI